VEGILPNAIVFLLGGFSASFARTDCPTSVLQDLLRLQRHVAARLLDDVPRAGDRDVSTIHSDVLPLDLDRAVMIHRDAGGSYLVRDGLLFGDGQTLFGGGVVVGYGCGTGSAHE